MPPIPNPLETNDYSTFLLTCNFSQGGRGVVLSFIHIGLLPSLRHILLSSISSIVYPCFCFLFCLFCVFLSLWFDNIHFLAPFSPSFFPPLSFSVLLSLCLCLSVSLCLSLSVSGFASVCLSLSVCRCRFGARSFSNPV